MNKTIMTFVALLLLLHASAQTLIQKDFVSIQLTPNKSDWTYKIGEEVILNISVLQENIPQKEMLVTYEWGTEKLAPTLKGEFTTKKIPNELRLKGSKKPGFMTCKASVKINNKWYSNYVNVAFEPEKIKPTTTLPENFEAFWKKELELTGKVPMRPLLTLMPDLCTPDADVYHVKIEINEWGSSLYGMLSKPKTPGKYPAHLTVPGAGIRPYYGDKSFYPAKGVITFEIGIHGIPVNLPQEAYDALLRGSLTNYSSMDLDNRYRAYYKRVYLGCSRAVDFLASLPEVDSTRIGVSGGSQGGALAIVTAALNKKITALIAFYPALCELSGYYNGSVGGWPHLFRDEKEPNRNTRTSESRYFDVVNFARFVTQPGWYSWGFNDQVCPPTTIFCAYNLIQAPKTTMIVRETAHWAYPEQYNASKQWMLQQLSHP